MVVKIKSKNGKEYIPCTIRNYKGYRKKLKTMLNNNPNLSIIGVMELPSKKYGFKVFGKDSFGVSDIDIFYTLGEINFFYHTLMKNEDSSM